MDSHPTIKTLDNMPRVLFWGVDEFMCLMGPLFLAMICGSVYIAFAGIILKPMYAKIKKRMPFGAIMHMVYWIFPTRSLNKILKTVPPSNQREYLL